jgi:hypothetical protein
MDNILSTLDEKVVPAAIAAGTPTALKTGRISHGEDLFKAFVSDSDAELSQVKLIHQMAVVEGQTTVEFDGDCKQAATFADAADHMNGWKAKEGATGAEKYGPKRKVLNARLSEARTLFGTFKRAPDLLKEKGYWTAIAIARDYLKANKIKWDGEPIESKEARAARMEHKARRAAIVEVLEENAMVEDIAAIQAMTAAKVFEDKVNAIVGKLEKTYLDDKTALKAACERILQKHSTAKQLDEYVQVFGETAGLIRMAEVEASSEA